MSGLLRIYNEEGHYTIKRVDKLPKRGNTNWLYQVRSPFLTELYWWSLEGRWETITVGSQITAINEGDNVTITGTGTQDDPYVVNAISVTRTSELINDGPDGLNPFLTDISDTSYVTSVILNNKDLIVTSNGDAFSGTIGLPFEYSLGSPVQNGQVLASTINGTRSWVTLPTQTAPQVDYISNVTLNQTDLVFTSIGQGFSGTIDLSDLTDNLDNFIPLSGTLPSGEVTGNIEFSTNNRLFLNSENIQFGTSNGLSLYNGTSTSKSFVDVSSDDLLIGRTDPASQATLSFTNNAARRVVFNDTSPNSRGITSNIDYSGSITNLDFVQKIYADTKEPLLGNPTGSGQVLASLTDGTRYWVNLPISGTNSLDYIENITLIGNDLTFFGRGAAFSDVITLPDNDTIDYISDISVSGSQMTFTGVGDAFNGTLNIPTGNQDYISNISINGNQLAFSGVGTAFTGVLTIPDTDSVDYLSNVIYSNGDLIFTGVGNAFNGTVSIPSTGGTSDYLTNVTLNGNQLTFSSIGNAFNGTLSLPTGSTDYISDISLNGKSLDFTGVGSASSQNIDFSNFVSRFGLPQNNQIMLWGGDALAKGNSSLTWDERSLMAVGGNLGVNVEARNLTATGTVSFNLARGTVGSETGEWALGMLDSTNENNFVIMPSLLPQNQTTEAFKIDSQTYGITAPRMTPSVIDNSADDKVLITKEWFQLNSSTGGSTDYISNVQANARTITFTGVGNAFNGSVTINQDISLAPTTQTIDIGNIGTDTIEDGFNAFTFSEDIQEQNEGYVLINTVQNGLPTQYLFVGTGGAYGTTGTLTAIDEDFTFIESTDFIDDTWRNSSGTQIAYGYNESIRHGGEVRANSFKVEDASDGGVIQNRRFGDLLIQGYTNLTLRGTNPNNSQVRITSNGSITAYDADRYRYNLIASRNYDSQAVYTNGARKTLVGIGITDRVLLTDAVNSSNMDYAALLINPNIVPGTETDKLFSIVSEMGDVIIRNGNIETDGQVRASTLNLNGIGTYADDAAAGTAGLVSGDVYKQPTGQLMVKN